MAARPLRAELTAACTRKTSVEIEVAFEPAGRVDAARRFETQWQARAARHRGQAPVRVFWQLWLDGGGGR